MYYTLKTQTSWQKEVTDVQLFDIRESMDTYPLIEQKFFEDIRVLTQQSAAQQMEDNTKPRKYEVQMSILQVKDPEGKDLNPHVWILLWAQDKEDRYYQVLIERNPEHQGKGAIAAVGPAEFFEFVSSMKDNMINPFLGMVNTPKKMKRVLFAVSQPPERKTYAQKRSEEQMWQALGRFQDWTNKLKMTPNKEGQWYPGDYPRCPKCENAIIGMQDEQNPEIGHLICPVCGYTETKNIFEGGKRPDSFMDAFKV